MNKEVSINCEWKSPKTNNYLLTSNLDGGKNDENKMKLGPRSWIKHTKIKWNNISQRKKEKQKTLYWSCWMKVTTTKLCSIEQRYLQK
jgi:hypothetical protein